MGVPTFGEWLTGYLHEHHVKQTEFAERIEISPQYLNDLLHDRRTATRRIVKDVASITDTNVNVVSVIAGWCPPLLQRLDIVNLKYLFGTKDSEYIVSADVDVTLRLPRQVWEWWAECYSDPVAEMVAALTEIQEGDRIDGPHL